MCLDSFYVTLFLGKLPNCNMSIWVRYISTKRLSCMTVLGFLHRRPSWWQNPWHTLCHNFSKKWTHRSTLAWQTTLPIKKFSFCHTFTILHFICTKNCFFVCEWSTKYPVQNSSMEIFMLSTPYDMAYSRRWRFILNFTYFWIF
jgi:hypothetical protein